MTSNITGTWFPSGFHGYTKLSDSRNDINSFYRHLAKPLPPNRFMLRVKQPPSKHAFSLHDNRNIFKGDAQHFGQGLGRKQTVKKPFRSHENLITWTCDKTHLDSSWHYISTYRNMFHLAGEKINTRDIFHMTTPIIHDQKYGTTTYQFSHGNANPYKEILLKKNEEIMNLKIAAPVRRPKTAPPILPDSVALCLRWDKPCEQSFTKDNTSTSTTSLITVSKDKATQI